MSKRPGSFLKWIMLIPVVTTVSYVCCVPCSVADDQIRTLREEIRELKNIYENRISELESKLGKMQDQSGASGEAQPTPATHMRSVKSNASNPSIGMILNGKFNKYSVDGEAEVAGFALGHEGERKGAGFAVDHTELNFSSNIDDKFYGSSTFAIAEHDGETEVELEEAYIQTLPGFMADGFNLKVGRFFGTLGYLNEHHSHADDFSDRPLPYRAILDGGYNDDGFELTYVFPTDLYTEVGMGLFRGNDIPFGGPDGKGHGSRSMFARFGGDIGANQSWRMGIYKLTGESPTTGRKAGHENVVTFIGDTDVQILDLRYTFAPTGNAREKEIIFQHETFWREENGTYEDTEETPGAGAVNVNWARDKVGSYTQLVYKWNPQWRVGIRYSELTPPPAPAALSGSHVDAGGFTPEMHSVMTDWTNSEFSRVRLQFNNAELAAGQNDSQWMLQYIMSIGAHGAHKY